MLKFLILNPDVEVEAEPEAPSTSSAPPPPPPPPTFKLKKTVKFPKMPDIPRRSGNLKVDSEAWLDSFRSYIRSIISSLVLSVEVVPEAEKDNLLESLTGPTKANGNQNLLLIWRLAFTHESAAPDVQSNYDQLEAVGDRTLGAAFKDFTRQKYPRVTDKELTEYSSRYMSMEFQMPLGKKMHLLDWVILHPSVEPAEKMYEDLFESFCGALVLTGDAVKPGLGYLLVRNIIRSIFGSFEYDVELSYGKYITVINQGYKSHKWGEEAEVPRPWVKDLDPPNVWGVTYNLTHPDFIAYVKSEAQLRNDVPPPNFTGIKETGRGASKDEANENAANQVMERLHQLGITTADIVQPDVRRTFFYRTDSEYRALADQAFSKARQSGISRLYITKPKNLKESVFYYMLLGVQADGVVAQLDLRSFSRSENVINVYTKILVDYLGR